MTLTESQKKMLTEFIGECWHEIVVGKEMYWKYFCESCKEEFPNPSYPRAWKPRSFLTWQDLGDCNEALVKKGLGEEFIKFCYNKWVYPETQVKINPATILAIRSSAGFDLWLFRPTDENDKAHFCRLVAEFMEKFVKQN